MALPKFKCTRCGEEFSAPDWHCRDGRKHEVETKIYFAHAHSLRTYVTEDCIETLPNGQKRNKFARYVQFYAGRYVTNDPEDQYALDQQTSEGALISEEEWKRLHFKPEDILKEENQKLRERLAKLENPLLDQVKAATKGK